VKWEWGLKTVWFRNGVMRQLYEENVLWQGAGAGLLWQGVSGS